MDVSVLPVELVAAALYEDHKFATGVPERWDHPVDGPGKGVASTFDALPLEQREDFIVRAGILQRSIASQVKALRSAPDAETMRAILANAILSDWAAKVGQPQGWARKGSEFTPRAGDFLKFLEIKLAKPAA